LDPDNPVVIRRARDPFGYLGNMSLHPVSYHGAGGEFETAEALFQALRFPRDSQTREEIRMARSPMAAKMIAKKNITLMHVGPRSAQDLDNMRFVLSLKVARHTEVKDGLLSTGDRHIVEDCSARQTKSGLYWGAALRDCAWFGLNTLGVLWMEMRERLRLAMQSATGAREQLRLEDV
jgi:predicted NAD-dependent protein-ADP-ribosyltransferase YbiA (DUF1768 family)